MDTDHFRVRLELFREKAQVMIQLLEGCRICDAFCSRLRMLRAFMFLLRFQAHNCPAVLCGMEGR